MATHEEIYSLDLRFLAGELKASLVSGVIRKIYQYGAGEKQFLFEVFVSGKGELWLYADKSKIFLTEYKGLAPPQPPNFCMFLRKHLIGQRIKDIRQHDFDRVLEIHTDDSILIFELFSDGNVILCDSSYKIIMPLEIQNWKDRQIRPKLPYAYPPKTANPFKLDFGDFYKALNKSDKKVIVFLATQCGFGQAYAKEICVRAGIDENATANTINLETTKKIHNIILSIDRLKGPAVYDDFVSPFPLEIYKSKKSKGFSAFYSALDEFFSTGIIEEARKEEEKRVKEMVEKAQRIEAQQKKAGEKWQATAVQSKQKANIIYQHYSLVEGILTGIQKARRSNIPWEIIKERIKSEDSPEANAIKEIKEHEGVVIVRLSDKDVELDIRKSVEENAAEYFEDVKHAKKKIERIEEAKIQKLVPHIKPEIKTEIKSEKEKLEKLISGKNKIKTIQTKEKNAGAAPAQPVLKKRIRKKWFEKFKWFVSSDGFLVVAGRDAKQNEMLIKKHTDPDDLVFHAEIQGAAFVVIKSEGKRIGLSAIKEASEFAAANSKAWSRGLGGVDVYCFKPEQASKSPPSGMSLPKGSFVIYGKKSWFKSVEIKLSIGLKIHREEGTAKVVAGPVFAVRRNSDYFVTIKPGLKKSFELATEIKNKILIKARPHDKPYLEVPLDEIQACLPSGTGEIVE